MNKSKNKKNPAAVALGKLGGKKGGKARQALLTPEERRELGKKGMAARWGKKIKIVKDKDSVKKYFRLPKL